MHNTEEEAHLFYKKALENKRHFNGNVESFKRLIGCHRIHFSSKVKGISFDKRRGKWRIRPIMNGFRKSFGYAETEKEAIEILNNIIK